MLFVILIILCIILIIILKCRNNNYWKKRNIVQVDGTLLKFSFGNCSLAEIYKEIYDTHPKEGYIGIFLGNKPGLILKKLEDIQAVLAGDFQSFNSRGIVVNPNEILTDNLLFMENFERWKLLRQKLSPVFTSSRLKNMFCILDKCGRDFVEFVEDKKNRNMKPFNALYTYTTASIGASIIGIDTRAGNTMESPFLDMSWKAVNPSLIVNLKFFIANTFPKLIEWLNLKFFSDHEDFFIGVIKKVLQSRRQNNEKRNDFIDTCLELQCNGVMKDLTTGYELEPTDEILASQAFFFFLAGADTSANTMHFTLLELSSNPKILERLHKEIDDVLGDKEELTYTDVERMYYLDMVINEALRKYPPIGSIQRKCTKNTVLSEKVQIEKDTLVIVPLYAIHRDEIYFPNPDLFDPERFSRENVSKIPKFSYMGFGEGNRICIGSRFARLQVKAGLVWLLKRFTLAEQTYKPERFERSNFSLRDPDASYDLIPRI